MSDVAFVRVAQHDYTFYITVIAVVSNDAVPTPCSALHISADIILILLELSSLPRQTFPSIAFCGHQECHQSLAIHILREVGGAVRVVTTEIEAKPSCANRSGSGLHLYHASGQRVSTRADSLAHHRPDPPFLCLCGRRAPETLRLRTAAGLRLSRRVQGQQPDTPAAALTLRRAFSVEPGVR
eukprot:CAMPEP_0167825704 /NCGR_PEP_ID=MMETSP0112_2-20121227/9540_1 /TAXON_ID=91324 /ORGANISM="Lotharella globosa, Strain CCCM811" /LENGTH=182 /DNA_ID=CAMNT_0007727893 /DNA_START=81 /DNA_END=629 /DNA_ORIENTATION=-